MQNAIKKYAEGTSRGDILSLARAISIIENDSEAAETLLGGLSFRDTPVLGITGPPGAGKSTLVDALIGEMVKDGKKIAVLCVDPSSPFNLGAVLGDRIRMSEWYNHPGVFIRSLATRGSMGGLHPKIIEITDLLKAAPFDHIIVETVGVGQSEIEIAGLADITVVVLVPEGGDEVQTMKAGLMEIADIFVVNKSDRPAADLFVKNLRQMLAPTFARHETEVPVMQTTASQKKGVGELMEKINQLKNSGMNKDKKNWLMAEKAWQLLQNKRMNGVSKAELKKMIEELSSKDQFNLYQFVQSL
jgi:LAO/AO transport system kinase